MMRRVQVHLIDGTYELFRHHMGLPPEVAATSRSAATRGVVRSVLDLIEGGATHVGVACDTVIESFRNDLWPGYKTGEGIEPALKDQFPVVEEALEALGVTVWGMVDLEADDALATAAARAAGDPAVERVVICTPDKDLAQCVVGTRVVQLDRRQDITRDEDGVRERFGVDPASIPDYLALVGDSADGFPGLPGWGAKSAATAARALGDDRRDPRRPGRVGRDRARGGAAVGVARGGARGRRALPRARHPARRRRRGAGGRRRRASSGGARATGSPRPAAPSTRPTWSGAPQA